MTVQPRFRLVLELVVAGPIGHLTELVTRSQVVPLLAAAPYCPCRAAATTDLHHCLESQAALAVAEYLAMEAS